MALTDRKSDRCVDLMLIEPSPARDPSGAIGASWDNDLQDDCRLNTSRFPVIKIDHCTVTRPPSSPPHHGPILFWVFEEVQNFVRGAPHGDLGREFQVQQLCH